MQYWQVKNKNTQNTEKYCEIKDSTRTDPLFGFLRNKPDIMTKS